MSVNRQVLIKIAAEAGYDLSQKFTDKKGNPKKVLVPLDDARVKPLASYEITGKPLTLYNGTPTDRLLRNSYPYSGYDLYRKQGIITPVSNKDVKFNNYKQNENSTFDTGILDINKTLASQLGGGPLAESTASALAEYARQKRYDALSSHDKRRYNIVAANTGVKPHAVTMLIPGNMSYFARKNLAAPEGVDEDSWNSSLILHDKKGNPLLYDSRSGAPSFPEGSVALNPGFFRPMFSAEESPDSKYKFIEPYTPNTGLFATNYVNGKVPVVRENFPVEDTTTPQTRGSLHSLGFMSTDKDGTSNVISGEDSNYKPDYEEFLVPGINLENVGLLFNRGDMARNDLLSNPRNENMFTYYTFPGDDKSILDHEAIHAMNMDLNPEVSLTLKNIDDTIERLNSRSPFNLIGKMNDRKEIENLLNDVTAVRTDIDSTSNGFLDTPNNYVASGSGEGLRAIVTALRSYQKHLMNVLPAQMEAKGELAGLTEKEKNDKIGWKIAELSHDGDNFINYLRESGVGDGVPTNWKILASSLGGMSGREMNRALEGLDEVMAPKEKMLELLGPEDLEKYKNSDQDVYKPLQEEYIRQIIQYLLHNDNKDAGSDGSVLA